MAKLELVWRQALNAQQMGIHAATMKIVAATLAVAGWGFLMGSAYHHP